MRLALIAAAAVSAVLFANSGLAQAPEPPVESGAAAGEPVEIPREQQLDTLFETLQSPDEAAAKSAEVTILRLWMESGSDTVDLLMTWSMEAIQEKNYPLALDFLDRVVTMQPDYAEGWNKRATVFYLTEEYGKSIADIGRVLELEPRHFGALGGLGMVMRSLGDNQRALAAYDEALAVHPHLDEIRKARDEVAREASGRET